MRLSHAIAPRASAMSVQRSSTGASRSTTEPITGRIAKACLRPGWVSLTRISPIVANGSTSV